MSDRTAETNVPSMFQCRKCGAWFAAHDDHECLRTSKTSNGWTLEHLRLRVVRLEEIVAKLQRPADETTEDHLTADRKSDPREGSL